MNTPLLLLSSVRPRGKQSELEFLAFTCVVPCMRNSSFGFDKQETSAKALQRGYKWPEALPDFEIPGIFLKL